MIDNSRYGDGSNDSDYEEYEDNKDYCDWNEMDFRYSKEFNTIINNILPELPETIDLLICDNCNLTEIKMLPQKLIKLSCKENRLSDLPQLPSRLKYLYSETNFIIHIAYIPKIFKLF